MWVYYFRSDSGDEYLDWADKQMNVGEAIMFFGWDDWMYWVDLGYQPDEIPYASFLREKIPWVH